MKKCLMLICMFSALSVCAQTEAELQLRKNIVVKGSKNVIVHDEWLTSEQVLQLADSFHQAAMKRDSGIINSLKLSDSLNQVELAKNYGYIDSLGQVITDLRVRIGDLNDKIENLLPPRGAKAK